ncbi:hypothetical protein M0802_011630 [Mischocyttarus mexicanus]|nr:hypothetical protein M0802_011630 [Mischocyttarus mexicanus]
MGPSSMDVKYKQYTFSPWLMMSSLCLSLAYTQQRQICVGTHHSLGCPTTHEHEDGSSWLRRGARYRPAYCLDSKP